jgi:site-specific DNA-methyltransferase (adenine-specific)
MEERSVDMVLCDLPYGMTDNPWDRVIELDALWEQYRRVVKPRGAVVLTASQPFTTAQVASNRKWFRHEWVWVKRAASGHLNANRAPMRKHENVLVFSSGAPDYRPQRLRACRIARHGSTGSANWGRADNRGGFQRWTGYPTTVLEFGADAEKLHPTQRPVALFEYLVRTYSHPGRWCSATAWGAGRRRWRAYGRGGGLLGSRRVGIIWRWRGSEFRCECSGVRVWAAHDNGSFRPTQTEAGRLVLVRSIGGSDCGHLTHTRGRNDLRSAVTGSGKTLRRVDGRSPAQTRLFDRRNS